MNKHENCEHDHLEVVFIQRWADDRLWLCLNCQYVVDRDRNIAGITGEEIDAHFALQSQNVKGGVDNEPND